MGAAVPLGNIVGKAEHLLAVPVVPLHGDFDADQRPAGIGLCRDRENIRVQHGLATVDVFDKALHAARERKVLFLAVALVDQTDLHAMVQERKLAQPLGQDLVVVLDVVENFGVGQEVHFRAALFGRARDRQRRHARAAMKLHLEHFAVTPDDQL